MTKKECSILRGVAILCIILHNFCKRIPFAVPENEYSFSLDNVLLFWNTLQLDTIFIQFFSFWGHLGVPAFVLLSGYGLALKYDRIEVTIPLFSLTYYTWLLVPLAITILAIGIVPAIPRQFSSVFDFVGKISMYAFVIHPIVREMNFLYDLNPYMGILLYVTITLTLSYLIDRILTKPINNK